MRQNHFDALFGVLCIVTMACSPSSSSQREPSISDSPSRPPTAGAMSESEIERVLSRRPSYMSDQSIATTSEASIGKGGWDTTVPMEVRAVSKVHHCVDTLRETAIEWAQENGMYLVRDSRPTDSRLQLLFRDSERSGLLEVRYLVDIQRGVARCVTAFYSLDGREVIPETLGIPSPAGRFLQAMTCGS